MNNKTKTIMSESPEETLALGEFIGANLSPGDLIALVGDLGSGKTFFVKGLAKGLGIEEYDYINSPSFVILKKYSGRKELYHFDVYRLEKEDFTETVDYERYFYGPGITAVEWADKVRDILPEEYLELDISHKGTSQREICLRPFGKRFSEIVKKIKSKE